MVRTLNALYTGTLCPTVSYGYETLRDPLVEGQDHGAPWMINYSNIYRGAEYASYRPEYPEELFRWLCSLPTSKEHAWDSGGGWFSSY